MIAAPSSTGPGRQRARSFHTRWPSAPSGQGSVSQPTSLENEMAGPHVARWVEARERPERVGKRETKREGGSEERSDRETVACPPGPKGGTKESAARAFRVAAAAFLGPQPAHHRAPRQRVPARPFPEGGRARRWPRGRGARTTQGWPVRPGRESSESRHKLLTRRGSIP